MIDSSLNCPDSNMLIASCCGTCSSPLIESLTNSEVHTTVFFYNPNIHPKEEYDRRRKDAQSYAQKRGADFVEGPYEPEIWLEKTAGMENLPERSARCSVCFRMRLEKASEYAASKNYKYLTSSFSISRWKDPVQVTQAAEEALSKFPGLHYWGRDWRQNGGGTRMYQIAREEKFYRQDYCGCIYSFGSRRKKI